MSATCRPLIEVLSEIPDCRKSRGKRHPLSSILALACVAMLCGYKSYSAIAEWGRNYSHRLVKALGFTHQKTPCAATLHNVFRRLDKKVLEAKLGAWSESLLGSTVLVTDDQDGIAIDGKTLRGSQKQGAPASHLLSALSHRMGLTLAQAAVDDKTNEISVLPQVLENLVLQGRVVTLDAMHTQQETARTIIGCEGDYIMVVKGNQPRLLDDIKLIFEEQEAFAERFSVSETIDLGHGRLEQSCLTTNSELVGYADWPGLQQVFQLQRRVTFPNRSQQFEETVYGITSLTDEKAGSKRLLEYIRQHWHIENKSHWVRDVTFDEDRSQVRCGSIPQVMAALRNTVIGMMRYCGETNIAAVCRRLAAQPCEALRMIGLEV